MGHKIQKALAKLSAKEREMTKLLLLRLKLGDTAGLDVKRLKGHEHTYRVRKGTLRIVFSKTAGGFRLLRIDRRNEKTYKGL